MAVGLQESDYPALFAGAGELITSELIKEATSKGAATVKFLVKYNAISAPVAIVMDIIYAPEVQDDAKYFVAAVNGVA